MSDSGNARSLIGKDLLDSKNIKFYPAEAGDNLYAANDSTIRVCGSVMLTATFKNKTIFIDCLVTKDLSRDIIISGHEAELIGAITISPDSHPAKLKQLPSICSTKTHRTGRPQHSRIVSGPLGFGYGAGYGGGRGRK